MTQNNFGIAYRDLAMIFNEEDNLKRAVDAYTEALKYYTPQSAPLHYAGTQYNLGIAYRALAKLANRTDNLQRAVHVGIEALKYYTPQNTPLDYALTQRNLGIVYEELGDFPAAIACWREAETYYRLTSYISEADLVLRWIAEAEEQLSKGLG